MSNVASSPAQLLAAVQAAIGDLVPQISPEAREQLAETLTRLIEEHVRLERARCVDVCRKRAQTWRQTSSATAPAAYAREEARARANEASYLADLLEAAQDLVGYDELGEDA